MKGIEETADRASEDSSRERPSKLCGPTNPSGSDPASDPGAHKKAAMEEEKL